MASWSCGTPLFLVVALLPRCSTATHFGQRYRRIGGHSRQSGKPLPTSATPSRLSCGWRLWNAMTALPTPYRPYALAPGFGCRIALPNVGIGSGRSLGSAAIEITTSSYRAAGSTGGTVASCGSVRSAQPFRTSRLTRYPHSRLVADVESGSRCRLNHRYAGAPATDNSLTASSCRRHGGGMCEVKPQPM